MVDVIFKQVRSVEGCNSFILGDAKNKKVCLIDPRIDELDLYEDFLVKKGLGVSFVLDTHTHADHYSATHLLAEKFNAPIAMAENTKSGRLQVRLQDNQSLEISPDFSVKVLLTPGHTPDSVCFLANGKWGSAVFTGDTLFIGGSGRTDFPGADAAAQYESIYEKLGSLDDKTWVFPGHDYSGLLFSTIGKEKLENPHWQFSSKESFVVFKNTEALDCGNVIHQIVTFNENHFPLHRPRGGTHATCSSAKVVCSTVRNQSVQEFQSILAEGNALCIDVREREEFDRGHIPGTQNIPLSELVFSWEKLASGEPVYLACQTGNRSSIAAQTLQRLGLQNITNLAGGYVAWLTAGFPKNTSVLE